MSELSFFQVEVNYSSIQQFTPCSFDKKQLGQIPAVDFAKIMTTVKEHLITSFVKDNLSAVAGDKGSHMVNIFDFKISIISSFRA